MKKVAIALAAAVAALFALLLISSSLGAGYEVNYTLYIHAATPYGAHTSAAAWMLLAWSREKGYMVLKPIDTLDPKAGMYAASEGEKVYFLFCDGFSCIKHTDTTKLEIVEAKKEKRGTCRHMGRSGELYVVHLLDQLPVQLPVGVPQEAEACLDGDILLWARLTNRLEIRGETYILTLWINATAIRNFDDARYNEVLRLVKE